MLNLSQFGGLWQAGGGAARGATAKRAHWRKMDGSRQLSAAARLEKGSSIKVMSWIG
jgi:hypothetical protein